MRMFLVTVMYDFNSQIDNSESMRSRLQIE